MGKISIRFFDDYEVRALWDDKTSKWWFSVLDILRLLRNERDDEKNRHDWKYLKAQLKREKHPLGRTTTRFKFTAPDGKKRLSTVLDDEGVRELAKKFPTIQASRFIEWFIHIDKTIDGKSQIKAYALFDSLLLNRIEVGTVKGLRQIHGYLFGGLYNFAGQIRRLNIAKGGFQFAPVLFLNETLKKIEHMPEHDFDNIAEKYVEMNVAHPFMEGNGRSMRIWLDLLFKKNLGLVVDWSQINKRSYLAAMKKSVIDSTEVKALLQSALTDNVNDRELFMRGIDYSYYYEQ